jgi:DNA-binding IclR family transcriptional regulator
MKSDSDRRETGSARMETQGNQGRTLERALDIIECVMSSRDPLTLTQVSRQTGLHIATTRRIIGQLVGRDYLRSSSQGYTLGPRVLPMSHTFVLQDRLALIAPQILSDLTAHTGLTSSVFVRTGDERVLIARVESPTPLSYQFPVGQLLRLTLGGGKVLLAYADEEDRERVLSEYESITLADSREQTADSLRADLEDIREKEFFISQAERRRGTVSITAPIWSHDNDLLGSVNLVGHDGTIDAEGIRDHQSILSEASRRFTMQM